MIVQIRERDGADARKKKASSSAKSNASFSSRLATHTRLRKESPSRMPVKMRFGSEEPAAGLAAAPAAAAAKATLAPHAAADDTASTSKASIATPTKRALNGGSMPNGKANGHENGSGKKKRKLVVFDEEAEQEAADKRAGIQTNGVGPRKRAQMDPEQRKKRLAEAQRLKPQREALPVYAGASTRLALDPPASKLTSLYRPRGNSPRYPRERHRRRPRRDRFRQDHSCVSQDHTRERNIIGS